MNNTLVKEVSKAMQRVLIEKADKLAIRSGFIKRRVKITGSKFCQTLVMGWLNKPEASLEELSQTAVVTGLNITAQGLEQRFTKDAAEFMQIMLEETISEVIQTEAVTIPILKRFKGVYLNDSSTISLPNELSTVWMGSGNSKGGGEAALKLEIRLNILEGNIEGPILVSGRTNDRKAAAKYKSLPKGSLSIADLGYWKLGDLKDKTNDGVYWLSRLRVGTVIFNELGERLSLAKLLDKHNAKHLEMNIFLGLQHKLRARLLAFRVPLKVAKERQSKLKRSAKKKMQKVSQERLAMSGWSIFVMNIPNALLAPKEIIALARMRWQIELIFKLWKSHGQIDKSRSKKPWRILCEVYSKLIAMIIQQWTFLIGHWVFPDKSLVKASKTVRQHALNLTISLRNLKRLKEALTILSNCLESGCRINKSLKNPRTFQLLLALDNLDSS